MAAVCDCGTPWTFLLLFLRTFSLQSTNFILSPDVTLNTEIHEKSARIMAPNQSMHHSKNIKIK